MLQLPMDTPTKRTFESFRCSQCVARGASEPGGASNMDLTSLECALSPPPLLLPSDRLLSQGYETVKQRGEMVAEDIFDLCRRIEWAWFVARVPAYVADLVVLIHRMDVDAIVEASTTARGGCFDRLYKLYSLEDLGLLAQVLCFGVSASEHYSEAVWLIATGELYAMDSMAACKHLAIVGSALMQFVEYVVVRRDAPMTTIKSEIKLMRKDHTSGIETQESGSNVCAFAASLFLGKLLIAAGDAASQEKDTYGDDLNVLMEEDTFAASVSKKLAAMKTTMRSYQKNREQMAKVHIGLCIEPWI